MAQTTQFTTGADARCTDGACGKVNTVVVDPVARAVTHLVIDRQDVPRLLPLDLIDATADQIRLGCTLAEFDQLDPAEKHSSCQAATRTPATARTRCSPGPTTA